MADIWCTTQTSVQPIVFTWKIDHFSYHKVDHFFRSDIFSDLRGNKFELELSVNAKQRDSISLTIVRHNNHYICKWNEEEGLPEHMGVTFDDFSEFPYSPPLLHQYKCYIVDSNDQQQNLYGNYEFYFAILILIYLLLLFLEITDIFQAHKWNLYNESFLSLKTLFESRQTLLPNDTLTICCEVWHFEL